MKTLGSTCHLWSVFSSCFTENDCEDILGDCNDVSYLFEELKVLTPRRFNLVLVSSIRDRQVHKRGRLSYADFVWFLISEEDKKSDTR